jgi:hypothetical protein
VANITDLANRVRLELGDLGKSFVQQFVADGTTNRFKLDYSPLDAAGVMVYKNGVDISDDTTVEESTGYLVLDDLPDDGDDFTVSGQYFRYFTQTEIEMLVQTAVGEHAAGHVDTLGRKITIESLPALEEYPVAVYATTLALYTLATDASFDIDVMAPDGVSIPRSERYRQLMEMMNSRQAQYRDLCVNLGVGLYRIDVFNLNRISKTTGRLIPVYVPQEVDDRSWPQRVDVPTPTLGNTPAAWPTDGGEITGYQGRAFTTTVEFSGDYDEDQEFVAKLIHQRGSIQTIQNFTLSIVQNEDETYTATISLTKDQTLRLAERTYWSIQTSPQADEVIGGNFFTTRRSTVVL